MPNKNYPGWEDYPATAARLKRAKYRAVPKEVHGVTFASTKEANRYEALLAEQQAGRISGLELQPRFPLHVIDPRGVKLCIGSYLADFKYVREGETVIEDSKGIRTPVYAIKKRHAECEYGIRILES